MPLTASRNAAFAKRPSASGYATDPYDDFSDDDCSTPHTPCAHILSRSCIEQTLRLKNIMFVARMLAVAPSHRHDELIEQLTAALHGSHGGSWWRVSCECRHPRRTRRAWSMRSVSSVSAARNLRSLTIKLKGRAWLTKRL